MVVLNKKLRYSIAHPENAAVTGYWLIRLGLVLSAVVLLLVFGCSKKVTVIEKPAVDAQQAPVAVPTPEPEPVRQVENIDSIARSILATIYFEFDNADIGTDEQKKLEAIGPFLTKYPRVIVRAEGNCDERGSSEYNIGLGERRAKAVKTWLTGYGIAGARVETTSFGKERPVRSDCIKRECHAVNRRVEWTIVAK